MTAYDMLGKTFMILFVFLFMGIDASGSVSIIREKPETYTINELLLVRNINHLVSKSRKIAGDVLDMFYEPGMSRTGNNLEYNTMKPRLYTTQRDLDVDSHTINVDSLFYPDATSLTNKVYEHLRKKRHIDLGGGKIFPGHIARNPYHKQSQISDRRPMKEDTLLHSSKTTLEKLLGEDKYTYHHHNKRSNVNVELNPAWLHNRRTDNSGIERNIRSDHKQLFHQLNLYSTKSPYHPILRSKMRDYISWIRQPPLETKPVHGPSNRQYRSLYLSGDSIASGRTQHRRLSRSLRRTMERKSFVSPASLMFPRHKVPNPWIQVYHPLIKKHDLRKQVSRGSRKSNEQNHKRSARSVSNDISENLDNHPDPITGSLSKKQIELIKERVVRIRNKLTKLTLLELVNVKQTLLQILAEEIANVEDPGFVNHVLEDIDNDYANIHVTDKNTELEEIKLVPDVDIIRRINLKNTLMSHLRYKPGRG